jgi:hypothetical protein
VLVFCQATLGLQSLAALFAVLATWGLERADMVEISPALLWGGGLGLVLALGYATGQQRKPWGRWLGWFLQLPMLVAGFIVPAIAIIGVMFLAIWMTALRLGGRIDRERAERLEVAASE